MTARRNPPRAPAQRTALDEGVRPALAVATGGRGSTLRAGVPAPRPGRARPSPAADDLRTAGAGASRSTPDGDAGRGLVMVGWTHHTCPLDLLEQVHLDDVQRAALLRRLHGTGWGGAVVLSTCGRTEVYAGPSGHSPDDLVSAVAAQLAVQPSSLPPTTARRAGSDVVEHLFRVAGGLDSRVVGHADGQRQVARACREAQDAGTTSPLLACLFSAALGAARRVHETTGLSAPGPTFAHRAVDAGLSALAGHRVPVAVVVGSGVVASAALARLHDLGHRPFVLARDASAVARLVGTRRLLPKAAFTRAVAYADLVVCATSSTPRLLTAGQVRAAMAGRGRTLALVDLSLPRAVDPAARAVPLVRLLDLDDLGGTTTAEQAELAAVVRACALVRIEARRFGDGSAVRANLVVQEPGASPSPAMRY